MNLLVITNPISGGGRSGRRAAAMARRLVRRGHRVELFRTSAPGDAARRASRVDRDVDRLVVVGGDGTLNEVLNGLEDPGRVPLAQLATGTANILAHELRLPRRPGAVADLVETGSVRRVDLGRVGDRRFLLVVSAGFDALVTRVIRERRRGPLGYMGYVTPILRALRAHRRCPMTVRLDDGSEYRGEQLLVCNTRNYGGLFTMAQPALLDDGRLDVCLLRTARYPDLARVAAAGLAGGIVGRANVLHHQAASISVRSPEPVPFQVDGDHAGTTPIEIRVEPRVVPIVVPVE